MKLIQLHQKILQRRCWTKPVVSVVPRDLDAFEIGRGAFVQAVERCDKAHAWQHALSLHQLMLEEGYGYSLSGFHALLMKEQELSASASASRRQNWQSAVHSLELMNLYDIFPSSITISLLISCCRRGNEWRWPLNFMMSHLEETKKGTHQLTDSHSMGSVIGTLVVVSTIFFIFTPKIGEMIQFDYCKIFSKWVG